VAPAQLSDRDLLDATQRIAGDERRTTAELLALLAELDTRKLYLGEGYSSLFTYCTQRLHLSESAAYSRITVARAARRFPILLARLAEGDVTLTSVTLLAAHLTADNHEELLDAARHASRRDVERLVASLQAQPDIPASVRRVPGGVPCERDSSTKAMQVALLSGSHATALSTPAQTSAVPPPAAPTRTAIRQVVAPLAADRYLLRVTIKAETQAKLERARDLLRHAIPDGEPAAILDRALTVLVDQLERRKTGLVSRPSCTRTRAKGVRGRYVPAAVRRDVWSRDQGRCAFVGPRGRCGETGFLEYHHVVPFAEGGATGTANLELRCRAHNAYEAAVHLTDEERHDACAATR
jgi:5-methylcytosine-specific restriction endonuclease McrA